MVEMEDVVAEPTTPEEKAAEALARRYATEIKLGDEALAAMEVAEREVSVNESKIIEKYIK